MRLVKLLKSKLHHVCVTYANPDYVGSIEVCEELMDRAGIEDGEYVHIWAVDHSARISTYAFRGPKGVCGLNGGAARFFNVGDRLIIATFTWTDEEVKPRLILVGEDNKYLREMLPYNVVG